MYIVPQWLDIFQRAKQGDEHLQAVLRRYSSLIAVKREKAYWTYLGHKEIVRVHGSRITVTAKGHTIRVKLPGVEAETTFTANLNKPFPRNRRQRSLSTLETTASGHVNDHKKAESGRSKAVYEVQKFNGDEGLYST